MSLAQRVVARVKDFLAAEQSTRALGLIRMGLAIVLAVQYTKHLPLWQWEQSVGSFTFAASFFFIVPLVFFGIRTRISTALMALWCLIAWGYYGKHLDGHMYFTHFGTPLLTVLLAFTPCGKSFSFDRLRALRRAEANGEDPPAELAPAWGQTVLRLHLTRASISSTPSGSPASGCSGFGCNTTVAPTRWCSIPRSFHSARSPRQRRRSWRSPSRSPSGSQSGGNGQPSCRSACTGASG